MKKYILSILILIAALGFIVLRGVESGSPQRTVSDTLDSDIHTLDRLFYDLGVMKIPGIEPPINITLEDVTGKKVRLSDFKGKIVFLNFWATWCSACRAAMPEMEKLNNRLKDKDFFMLAINLQEPLSRVKSYLKSYKLNFTTLLDTKGNVASSFRVMSIPTTLILDKDGDIIGKVVGARKWNSKDAISLFEYLVKEDADYSFINKDS